MLGIPRTLYQVPTPAAGAKTPVEGTETSAHKRLSKAAQEFEGMLMTQLLQDSNLGFSSLGGDTPLAGSETLNSLAIQTLATAMAGRGGFGIAKMLVEKLGPSVDRKH